MDIRWRLGVLALQLLGIAVVTAVATGSAISSSVWFASLLALVINTQLLEPYFAKPVDTLANSLIGLVFYGLSSKTITGSAWHVLAIVLSVCLIASAIALIFGAGKRQGLFSKAGRVARVLSKGFVAKTIYSAIFWLALLDYTGTISGQFWTLGLGWLFTVVLASVNWQDAFSIVQGAPVPVRIEGMIGPSRLLVGANVLPQSGTPVEIRTSSSKMNGVVISRIRRKDDVWAEIYVPDPDACESLLSAKNVNIKAEHSPATKILGVVDARSTHATLVFTSVLPLSIGQVVAVPTDARPVLYQLKSAEVYNADIKSGSNLAVRITARQIGVYEPTTFRLRSHKWVPQPGVPVIEAPKITYSAPEPSSNLFLIGHVIDTSVPVYLDCSALCEGHLAILGMTRMGKSTFALRLARDLSNTRSVTILDQTGEYSNRHGIDAFRRGEHDTTAGLSVFEPSAGTTIPEEGLKHLKNVLNKGYEEYRNGTPFSRVLLVDEAHQFVPEPAILGFGSPGRESAITFGMNMMQVRKYGITIALISQRTAVVAKSALSQCENVIAFKSVDQTGLDYLEAVCGEGARETLPTLSQGEAFVFGPAITTDGPVAVKVALP